MSLSLYDTIRKIVQEELKQLRSVELALIQEIHTHAGESDTDNYACTVVLRDSGIVLNKVAVATQKIGFASIPAIGELVMVQFIGGDINAPIITGRLYNDEERAPLNDQDQMIMELPLGAGDGEGVRMEVNSGDEKKIILEVGSGLKLTLLDDDPVVDIEIDGGAGQVTIGRDGALQINSGGDIDIEGSGINITAQGELNLKGSKINLN